MSAQPTIFDVANWFLSKSSMTPKKLQKLVYYAYAWTLALENECENDLDIKLFSATAEAWVHGMLKIYWSKFGKFTENLPGIS